MSSFYTDNGCLEMHRYVTDLWYAAEVNIMQCFQTYKETAWNSVCFNQVFENLKSVKKKRRGKLVTKIWRLAQCLVRLEKIISLQTLFCIWVFLLHKCCTLCTAFQVHHCFPGVFVCFPVLKPRQWRKPLRTYLWGKKVWKLERGLQH